MKLLMTYNNWKNRANRFSHDMSFVALEDNQVLGVITCNPLKQIDRAMTPTVLQIILMNKLKPFLSIISHPKSFIRLLRWTRVMKMNTILVC